MRDILVHSSNYAKPTHGMQYAADVARLFDGSLTGIFVTEPIVPVAPIGMMPVVPDLYVAEDHLTEDARAAEPAFNEWARSRGLTRYRWQVTYGFLSAALTEAACFQDALVLESGRNAPWTSAGVVGHILVHCGVPCFVVPEAQQKPACFDTVAIASHGSPESIRAVHAVLPVLARAKRIVLIKGEPRDTFTAVGFRPAFTIEDHLKAHGLDFSTCRIGADDERIGESILGVTEDSRADLLVMGAYGRTRFSEWVLGGATRHVLEKATLPLFMRH